MKKVITKIETYQYFYPYTVALFGASFEGRTSFMSVAWHTPLSYHPPLFAVLAAKKRFTHGLVAGAKEFTVNFLSYSQAQLSANMGRTSGRDRDKVKDFKVTLAPAKSIASPIIAESYAALECKLVEARTYGDHDLFVGEVLAVQQEEDAFDDQGFLATHAFPPLLYLGTDVYITVDPATRALVRVKA